MVTHVAKTNPFGLFASQYQLGYEHGLNDNFSVQLSAGFMGGTVVEIDWWCSQLGGVGTQRTLGSSPFPIEHAGTQAPRPCEGFYLAAVRHRPELLPHCDEFMETVVDG